jgi:hypothetical protein
MFYDEYKDVAHCVLIVAIQQERKTSSLKVEMLSCFTVLIKQHYNLYYFNFINQAITYLRHSDKTFDSKLSTVCCITLGYILMVNVVFNKAYCG